MNVEINAEKISETIAGEFNFTVEKKPLFSYDTLDGRSYETPVMGLFRSDTRQYVGKTSVTDRYTPHTTEDVIALSTAAAAAFDGEVSLNCHWNDGHYVNIVPPKEYRCSIFGTKDNIFPRLLIQAGYNGKSFQATLGYFRDLCQNMAMLESANSTHVNIKHTHSLRHKIDKLIYSMRGLREGWENLTQCVRRMEMKDVNLGEFLDEVYGQPNPESRRSQTMHRNRINDIIVRVKREQLRSDRPVQVSRISAWEAFNGVQGYAQHEQSRRRNPTYFDRMLKAIDDKYVRKAERLALAV